MDIICINAPLKADALSMHVFFVSISFTDIAESRDVLNDSIRINNWLARIESVSKM